MPCCTISIMKPWVHSPWGRVSYRISGQVVTDETFSHVHFVLLVSRPSEQFFLWGQKVEDGIQKVAGFGAPSSSSECWCWQCSVNPDRVNIDGSICLAGFIGWQSGAACRNHKGICRSWSKLSRFVVSDMTLAFLVVRVRCRRRIIRSEVSRVVAVLVIVKRILRG